MKTKVSLFVLFIAVCVHAANPAFTDFNGNQFGTTGNKVVIKNGVLLTNPVIALGVIIGNGSGLSNVVASATNLDGSVIWALPHASNTIGGSVGYDFGTSRLINSPLVWTNGSLYFGTVSLFDNLGSGPPVVSAPGLNISDAGTITTSNLTVSGTMTINQLIAISQIATNFQLPALTNAFLYVNSTGGVMVSMFRVTTNAANLTANVLIGNGTDGVANGAASGAVPVDADGSATTLAQLQTLGVVSSNDNRNLNLSGSNIVGSLMVSNVGGIIYTGAPLHVIWDNNTSAGVNPRGIINDSVDNWTHGVHWENYKARGTRASKTNLASADFLGGVVFSGYDGSAYVQSGVLGWQVTGIPATGFMPSAFYIGSGSAAGAINNTIMGFTNGVGINYGTTSTLTPNNAVLPTGAALHVQGLATPVQTGIMVDNFAADTSAGAFIGRHARGSSFTSLTAVAANDGLAGLFGRGATNGGFGGNSAAVTMFAAETFTAAAQGSYITFGTTPTSSTTRAERVRINQSGGVGIGSTVDPGANSLLVAGSITGGSITATNSLLATNGIASFASVASVAIDSTGWTNIWSTNNAVVVFGGTTVSSWKKRAGSGLTSTNIVYPLFTGNQTVILQPGQAVVISGTAVSGSADPF